LVGGYAQRHYLGDRVKATLTETVRAWREYAPSYVPLPHPSFRNLRWLRQNPWFELEVIPALRTAVHGLLEVSRPPV
jgi:uracil-DNA glycosylase